MANSLKDFASQVVGNVKKMPLSQAALDRIASIYASGDKKQIAVATTFLQNNLSEEHQAQVLGYLSQSTSGGASSAGVDPLTVDTNIDIPAIDTATDYGVDTQNVPDLTADSGSLGSVNLSNEYDQLAMEAVKTTEQFLRGELSPASVSQLESISGEKSLAAGLGTGSASRNLTARDLGLTSEQLQEKGLAAAPSIGGMLESKRQYNIATQTNIDEFNKNFGLQQAQLKLQAQQLSLDEQQQEIAAQEFNASMALELNKLIVSTWQFTQDLAFKYRTTKGEGGDVDTSGLTADEQALISDLSSLIG